MGSASSIPTEPIVAAAVAGALGYGYVHYFRLAAHAGDEDAYSDANAGASNAPPTLRGQKKRGRKLQLPGDATLKNLDFLDAPVVPGSLSSRERQRQAPPQPQQDQRGEAAAAAPVLSRDVVPGGFDGTATSADDARDQPQEQLRPPLEQVQVQQHQQHVSVGTTKKPKKKKGKKVAAATSDPSSASALGASQSLSTSTEGVVGKGKKATASTSVDFDAVNAHDERWTRVEARKKKAPLQPQDGSAETAEATAADVTTSDAGITTSVTGNSSPVTERTTEDELRSDLDERCTSPIVPIRPPPGEKPAKGFSWEDYEGVHVDEDASGEEDGGWGVVRSRRKPNKAVSEGAGGATGTATTTTASQSQPQTKKQRQNAQRREALKEAKREREAQQQAALATHKRELDRTRTVEQVAPTSKRTGSRFDSLG
ncbi:hypothetical protein BGY98DRAFT_1131411 [Russula aff. rugulosa BPL654]|nr:hypothetical protein BGY98DRAFT_1131411 [Russula aff. rugulosa BPL654]